MTDRTTKEKLEEILRGKPEDWKIAAVILTRMLRDYVDTGDETLREEASHMLRSVFRLPDGGVPTWEYADNAISNMVTSLREIDKKRMS